MGRYELSDFEWNAIEPHLPNKPRGVPRVDDTVTCTVAVAGGCDRVSRPFILMTSAVPKAENPAVLK